MSRIWFRRKFFDYPISLKLETVRLCGLVCEKDGRELRMEGDYIISSMPVQDLVLGMNDVPGEIRRIAEGLLYRRPKRISGAAAKRAAPRPAKRPTSARSLLFL